MCSAILMEGFRKGKVIDEAWTIGQIRVEHEHLPLEARAESTGRDESVHGDRESFQCV